MSFLFYTPTGQARLLPTCILVLLVTLALAIRVPTGLLAYKSDAVLTIVVPIAGTLVALALPAAQLAQSVMEAFLSSAQELIKGSRPIPAVADYLHDAAIERKRELAGVRCVIVFSVASLLAGLFGLLGPVTPGESPSGNFALRDFIASFSMTALVASILWLIPVVRSSFSFAKGGPTRRTAAKGAAVDTQPCAGFRAGACGPGSAGTAWRLQRL